MLKCSKNVQFYNFVNNKLKEWAPPPRYAIAVDVSKNNHSLVI
jgi:hypothetical protein